MMESGAKAQLWLRNAALGVFVLALAAGIFLPVYTDEVGWRLQERAGFDGIDKLFSQVCGPNTLAQPPFWMMPARYYSALFNSLFAEPIYVRLSGILYALVWTGMLLSLVRRVAPSERSRLALSTMALGFLSLGTMPLLLVWSRPEQPIMLAFTGALLVAFSDWDKGDPDTPARNAWLRSLAVLLLAALAMSYHIKALFTVPLFLACLYFASRGRAAHVPRIVVAAILVAAAAWAAHYWVSRLDCPNAALVREDFIRNNTGAALVGASHWSQILPLITGAIDNISLFQYLGMPVPREEPMSAWLPLNKIDVANSFAGFLVMMFAWILALLFSAACLIGAVARAWRKRELDARTVFVAALFAGILGWSATQGMRNVYEAIFVVPMAVVAVVLALSTSESGGHFGGGVKVLSAALGIIGIVSVALVAAIYGPSLARAMDERGYIKDQPFSISAFGYSGLRRDMLAAARKCGIADPDANHSLVVDDITYFAFMKSSLPEHSMGKYPEDMVGYLRGIRSDGIIASCRLLPPQFRARAQSEGQFCCVAPPNW